MPRWLRLAMVAGIAALVLVLMLSFRRDPHDIRTGTVGRPAAAFSLQRLEGAGTVSLADAAGKVVVVNFFASWCIPCKQENPALVRMWARYRSSDVVFVALTGAIAWSARPHEASPAERIDRITADLRCVVCQGLSVKDSPAESARQMRDLVAQRVAEGRTDDEIRDEFRRSYGDWVLLSPPVASWTGLVWLVPLVALLGGLLVALGGMRGRPVAAGTPTAAELALLRERVAREEAVE